MPRAWISVGSNIGRKKHIRAAIDELHEMFGALAISPVYETVAVGFAGDAFYNLVVGIDTQRAPNELHRLMREIESRHGRERGGEKFASRTLDLDILTYGDAITDEGGKHLPRDEILKYAFVLAPLADVAPDERHPELDLDYRVLWDRYAEADRGHLQRLADISWLTGDAPEAD